MKAPKTPKTPVNAARMREWIEEFAGYRVTVNEGRIDRWLKQFQTRDRDIAARVLDVVEFVSKEQIAVAFRQALKRIPKWSADPKRRKGRWRFVPFTASAGESGDTMLHEFRIANGMAKREFNELFVYKSDLPGEQLGPSDTVVFVDDFSGTGVQAIDHWEVKLKQLLPQSPSVYLVVVLAGVRAVQEIGKQTGLVVIANGLVRHGDNIFHQDCRHFSKREKAVILRYCERAKPDEPRGYGDSGLVVVFPHRCPNNSIPILHNSRKEWGEGLFRRSD